MAAKNQTIVARGSDGVWDVYFYAYSGGNLIDSVPDPTWRILDPLGVEQATGTGVRLATGTYEATWTIPIDAELSNQWVIEWTGTINGSTIIAQENFIVVESGDIGFGGDVIISTSWMEQIKKVLAYPDVDNVLLSDEQIKQFCIYPAMIKYFTKFPIREYYEGQITGTIEIDFPDDNVFGVLDCRLVNRGLTTQSSSNFFDIVRFQTISGNFQGFGVGAYGIKGYNPSNFHQRNLEQMNVARSVEKQYSTIKYRVEESEKKIYVHTTIAGVLNITWAKYSLNFDHVNLNKQFDVIKLCQANLLEHLADTTNIYSDSSNELVINTSDLKSRAEELRESVLEKWNQYPDIIVLQN